MTVTIHRDTAELVLGDLLAPSGADLLQAYINERNRRENELSGIVSNLSDNLHGRDATIDDRNKTIALLQSDIADLRERLAGKVGRVATEPAKPVITKGRYRFKPDGAECDITRVANGWFYVTFPDGQTHEITLQREDVSPETIRLSGGYTHNDWAKYFEPITTLDVTPCPFKVGDWVRDIVNDYDSGDALIVSVLGETFTRTLHNRDAADFSYYIESNVKIYRSTLQNYVKVPAPFWAGEVADQIAALIGGTDAGKVEA